MNSSHKFRTLTINSETESRVLITWKFQNLFMVTPWSPLCFFTIQRAIWESPKDSMGPTHLIYLSPVDRVKTDRALVSLHLKLIMAGIMILTIASTPLRKGSQSIDQGIWALQAKVWWRMIWTVPWTESRGTSAFDPTGKKRKEEIVRRRCAMQSGRIWQRRDIDSREDLSN